MILWNNLIVVVRPRPADDLPVSTRRVVVGVDGSGVSGLSMSFAFQAAARRGVGITAVRAWDVPMPVHPSLLVPLDKIQEAEQLLLLKSLAGRQRKFPGVDVQIKLINAHPGHALVVESAGAGLLVVGSRGLGGFAGMLLGSVSQAVLRHASCRCPVAVVRPHR
ncbi:MAG: universal stress protein [Dermatophilaceae bacterium]